MARFMDFHEDLKLPAEAIAQIADSGQGRYPDRRLSAAGAPGRR